MKMIEAIAVKEGVIQDDGAAVPVRRPAPPAPSPSAPAAEIQSEIDARAPTETNINPWIEKRRVVSVDRRSPNVCGIIVGDIPNIRIGRFDVNRGLPILLLHRYCFLRSGLQFPRSLRLRTHSLNRLHDIRLLREDRVAQGCCPAYPLIKMCQDLREGNEALDTGVPVLFFCFLHQFGGLPFCMVLNPLLRLSDLKRIS